MKLACSVEVVRHGLDLKARAALKLINRISKQEARRKAPKVNAGIASRPQSKKLEAKCQHQNVSDDWTLIEIR